MTPAQLEQIGRRMYGRRWRSLLALNIGRNVATIHRWGKRENIDAIAEVAVRGLLERWKTNQAAEKLVTERLRREGKLRPKLRTRKKKKNKQRFDLAEQVAALGADSLLPPEK